MLIASPYLVRARVLTGFIDVVAMHDGDGPAMLNEAGISPGYLDNPDAAIPFTAFAVLLNTAATKLRLPDFGLRMASYQDVTVLGAISLIALNAATTGEALDGILRHLTYHSTAMRSRLTRVGETMHLELYHAQRLPDADRRQLVEHTFHNAVRILRSITQCPGNDWEVHFDFAPGLPLAAYAAAFACPVHFGAKTCWLEFPVSLLDIRVQTANTVLHDAAERNIRSLIRRRPLDITQQTEDLVKCQLGSSPCTLPVIASQLAVSGATLQRRLAERGTCFEDIVDNIRRQRACELLPIDTLSTQLIAECLGYTSQTSLTRSCRRWFGSIPTKLRRR